MKLIRMILIAAICFVLLPFTAVRADSSEPGFMGQNVNAQNYDRWSTPMKSNLVRLDSGYMIVHANSGTDVKAAYYDENYVLYKTISITDGLPLFGGFHAGTDGYYYIVTSGLTGWSTNQAKAFRTKHLLDIWEDVGDPCIDDETHTTFNTQSTNAFTVKETGEQIIMLERHNTSNFLESSYVWLPIRFNDDNTISLNYQREWKIK
jgi:hypothetical protein